MYVSFEYEVTKWKDGGKCDLIARETGESMKHVHVPIWDEKLEGKASQELSRRLESWP